LAASEHEGRISTVLNPFVRRRARRRSARVRAGSVPSHRRSLAALRVPCDDLDGSPGSPGRDRNREPMARRCQ
jgi:hypothetical protein